MSSLSSSSFLIDGVAYLNTYAGEFIKPQSIKFQSYQVMNKENDEPQIYGDFLFFNIKDKNNKIYSKFADLYEYLNKILFSKINANMFVAGGFIRKVLNNENWINSDIDIYFENRIDFESAKSYFLAGNGVITKENDNSCSILYDNRNFDLIKSVYPTPLDALNSFDFTVCCCSVSKNGNIFYHMNYFDHLDTRKIHFNKIDANKSIVRLQRYILKGYTIDNEEIHKLCLEIIKSYTNVKDISENYCKSEDFDDDDNSDDTENEKNHGLDRLIASIKGKPRATIKNMKKAPKCTNYNEIYVSTTELGSQLREIRQNN